MALSIRNNIQPEPKGVPVITPTTQNASPFLVIRNSVDAPNQKAKVFVSPYSVLMDNFSATSSVPIAGLEYIFSIEYGDKIWLETFYDFDLNPSFSRIQKGKRWSSSSLNSSGLPIESYPSYFEYITHRDINNKIVLLEDFYSGLDSTKNGILDLYQDYLDFKYISQEKFTIKQQELNSLYQSLKDGVRGYINDFNNFFINGVGTKKLFRTFTLLAYTTKNFDGFLDGSFINIPIKITAQGEIPQSQSNNNIKLVQCVFSNLLCIDTVFNNSYAAKIPVPFTSPVNKFVNLDGDIEDDLFS